MLCNFFLSIASDNSFFFSASFFSVKAKDWKIYSVFLSLKYFYFILEW